MLEHMNFVRTSNHSFDWYMKKVSPLIIRGETFYHSRHSSVISSSDSKPAIRAAVSINS